MLIYFYIFIISLLGLIIMIMYRAWEIKIERIKKEDIDISKPLINLKPHFIWLKTHSFRIKDKHLVPAVEKTIRHSYFWSDKIIHKVKIKIESVLLNKQQNMKTETNSFFLKNIREYKDKLHRERE